MFSLCRLPMAKNHNFRQIVTFLGAPVPFTDDGQIWCPIADHGIRLSAKFRLDRFIPSSCSCGKPQFLPFFGLRHLVVLPIGSSLRQLNTGTQLQTFPYPMVSESFLYSHAFMAKSGAQSLTFKRVTNRQTDKQKNSTFLAAPAAGEIRAPANLALVIEDLEHVLAPLKRLGPDA